MTDWSTAPYVRIYSTLSADHPRVWSDLRLLGAYVRLLSVADPVWPGLAEVPRGIPADVLADLVADEVVDVDGDLFRFHGLATERNGRRSGRSRGGIARSTVAERDEHGRFVQQPSSKTPRGDAGDAGETSSNGRMLDDAGDAGPMLVANAGPSSIPARPPASPPARKAGEAGDGSTTPARAPASAPAREPSPTQIYCESYAEHRGEHQWWEGIGWRCSICERSKADAEPTFREKVMRASDHASEDPF